jgi:hypothetical protein
VLDGLRGETPIAELCRREGIAASMYIAPIQPFTEPVVRLDLDRMDDNDNRLFGVTAEIMWVPKPAYMLTLRTPLYFVRN